MRKKQYDPYERQRQRHYDAFSSAPKLKEQYPQLDELTIQLSFKEPDWGDDPADKEVTFGAESKALFEIECPHVECMDGGFNLASAVSDLVEKGLTESKGSIICQGWQDLERINKHRCLLRMNFVIRAKYKC